MIIGARAIPRSDVRIGPLTFGSMRMHERSLRESDWAGLLRASFERGVTACHSSDEYESFPIFRSVLDRLRRDGGPVDVQHVVKLAEPHFEDASFAENRLRNKVDAYLHALRAPRLDVVQWMWRGDLKDEPMRLRRFEEQVAVIGSAFASLRREGKVGAVMPFPYTPSFAVDVARSDWCDGLSLYLNRKETEYVSLLPALKLAEQAVIALRPLAAGRAIEADCRASDAMRWTMDHACVVTGVASYSTVDHLDELLGATS